MRAHTNVSQAKWLIEQAMNKSRAIVWRNTRFVHEHAHIKAIATLCCNWCRDRSTKLKKCTGCHMARFCSDGCMREAWSTHKPLCLAWRVGDLSKSESWRQVTWIYMYN
mmetsp:Transcript_14042/g.37783  ORF Transcript_14042/g.37783 Transcript_14042/m.37783 type:complete len:109 (-) Transcript_14042:83-409(-)